MKVLDLGSGPNNRIRVDDPTISHFHCRFTHEDKKFYLKDMDSQYGTFIEASGEIRFNKQMRFMNQVNVYSLNKNV